MWILMTQREVLGWNQMDGGRKGERGPGQRAWQVMSKGSILGKQNTHKLNPPLLIFSSVASACDASLLCRLSESYPFLSIFPNPRLDLLNQSWKWGLEIYIFNKFPKSFYNETIT